MSGPIYVCLCHVFHSLYLGSLLLLHGETTSLREDRIFMPQATQTPSSRQASFFLFLRQHSAIRDHSIPSGECGEMTHPSNSPSPIHGVEYRELGRIPSGVLAGRLYGL